jgi:BspA type Leucine rich repeat region (6 copies)
MRRKVIIIWGAIITGLLGANILYTWVIWEGGKVLLSQHVAGLKVLSEEISKLEKEMRILKTQVEKQVSVIKKNSETHKTEQIKENPSELGSNFKMFPNTQREGAYEYLVTNNQVVIVRFHGLGTESHVIIPEKIQDIPVVKLGKMSFLHIFRKIDGEYTDNLVKVTLPQTLEEIEGGSFRDHHNLSEVDLPPKIAVINEFTFQNCGFTNLVLPNTVQKIEKNAFWINLKLKSVIIPSSVKFIGKGAFSGCRNLTNIEILGTNTVIDAEAFQYCPRQPANPQSPTNPQQNP